MAPRGLSGQSPSVCVAGAADAAGGAPIDGRRMSHNANVPNAKLLLFPLSLSLSLSKTSLKIRFEILVKYSRISFVPMDMDYVNFKQK